MEMMELCYHICYTLCFEFCLPPFMDWMESFVTMNMTAEIIFYTCLTLFFDFYLPRLVRRINPSFKVTAEGMLPAIVIVIIVSYRLNCTFASTTTDLKMSLFHDICLAFLFKLLVPRIIHWIHPSLDVPGEFLLIPFVVTAIIEFHRGMPLSELEPLQESLEAFSGARTLPRKVMAHTMNGRISYN